MVRADTHSSQMHEYGCDIQEYDMWPVTVLLLFAVSNSPTVALQLANEQAQSLEASLAAEERIQALEQRLASQQQGSTADQTAAGDPPAMAAPGHHTLLPHVLPDHIGIAVAGTYFVLSNPPCFWKNPPHCCVKSL